MNVRTPFFAVVILSAASPVFPGHSDAFSPRGQDGIVVVENLPGPGLLTVMSQWLDGKLAASAVVLETDEQGRILCIHSQVGDKTLWKGILDRFCRSEYAFDLVAPMVEQIPVTFRSKAPSEEEVFSFLPFFFFKKSLPGCRYKANQGAMLGYCLKCSKAWQNRRHNERIVVLDKHDNADGPLHGYMLEFSDGRNAAKRKLQHVFRLTGKETESIYGAGANGAALPAPATVSGPTTTE